ncbi:hypothetical protein AAM22_gp89 [Pantoea phage vB_PagM_AAM22]|nr:hypothetical protein AAM22_gp89 [Pantoea phage vB_PagM_AAM22]
MAMISPTGNHSHHRRKHDKQQ